MKLNELGDNPVLALRQKLAPTNSEVMCRSIRDRSRSGLLQRELATRMKCSASTVRDMEREKRIPNNEAIQDNFMRLVASVK